MADMQTAVEVLARALPRVTMDASRISATALLADLEPLIRADEREACAKVADGYHQKAVEWARKIRGLEGLIDETDSSRIAAAIRQRGNE